MSSKTLDRELAKRIAAMEANKRKKAIKDNKVSILDGSNGEKISFDTWWAEMSRNVNIKPWMKEVLRADFKGRGLQKEETRARFEEALKLFGFKA